MRSLFNPCLPFLGLAALNLVLFGGAAVIESLLGSHALLWAAYIFVGVVLTGVVILYFLAERRRKKRIVKYLTERMDRELEERGWRKP